MTSLKIFADISSLMQLSTPTTDYGTPPSSLTLAAEVDPTCFTIPLIDDDIALEGDEVFSVTLSNPVPSSVSIITFIANITIVDNDGEVIVSFTEIYNTYALQAVGIHTLCRMYYEILVWCVI